MITGTEAMSKLETYVDATVPAALWPVAPAITSRPTSAKKPMELPNQATESAITPPHARRVGERRPTK